MGETPFSLCYDSKALIPVKIEVPTLRVELFSPKSNEQNLRDNLDLLDELHDQVNIQEAVYNRHIERFYNRRVKAESFLPRDWVLRWANVRRTQDANKLTPNWEGPFKVEKTLGPNAYKLQTAEGVLVKNTWNVQNLRKFYQ